MKSLKPTFAMIFLILSISACSLLELDHESGESLADDPANGLVLSTLPPPPRAPLCLGTPNRLYTLLYVIQPAIMKEPHARTPFLDQDYGTCIVRVTDRNIDLIGSSTLGLKNEYSRVQSFNADGSLMMVRSVEGTWHVYATTTLLPVGQVPIDVDPRWSAQDPYLIYFSSETRLMAYDLKSGETQIVHDFSQEIPGAIMVWTRYEGSPSRDGQTWGLMVEDNDWLTSAFIVYSLRDNTVAATLDLRNVPTDEREIDSVTISPLGDYFLVQMDKYCEYGILGTPEQPCGFMVYDRQLKNGRGLLRVVGHSDTALDTQGREVLVYQDIDTDHLSMVDLETGIITPLLSLDFSHTGFGLHISGRAFELPGWVVISTHDGDPSAYTWMDDSIFAVELVAGGRVFRLASTHSLVDDNMGQDYWAEPQASTNQNLTRILFTSNWGRSGSEAVEMYMIELAQQWSSALP